MPITRATGTLYAGRAPLLALVAANAVSLTGNVLAAVAIPWFVLVTTGSAARPGLAAFFLTLPFAAGAFLGGAVVDRVGARRASVVADLANGLPELAARSGYRSSGRTGSMRAPSMSATPSARRSQAS